MFVSDRLADEGPMTPGEVYDELLRTGRMAVRWRDGLEAMVGQMKADWRYSAFGAGTEQLRSEVVLYERAMDRTARVLELIARLNIDARAAALSAKQGEVVADAVRRAVEAVDLPDATRDAIYARLAAELRRAMGTDSRVLR